MNITELSREQMEELKQSHLIRLDDSGELEEKIGIGCVSWGDLADADILVPDAMVLEEYGDIDFCNDDFFCTAGRE